MVKKKETYKLREVNGKFTILVNENNPLLTPDGHIFEIAYEPIANKVVEDLEEFGSDSYTNPL